MRASSGFDHLGLLEVFGFGDMKWAQIDGQVCFVEHLYRPDQCFIHQIPATALQAARARAFARLPPAGPANRRVLLIPRPPRDIANRAVVEKIATKAGLEVVELATLGLADQIELFRHARLIVGHSWRRAGASAVLPAGDRNPRTVAGLPVPAEFRATVRQARPAARRAAVRDRGQPIQHRAAGAAAQAGRPAGHAADAPGAGG
ncbi:MAG: glycosyltransferase family 61 protein [Rhodospirillales bacterium]